MDEEAKSLLIIFYRNPEIGKVKTRLAATVGDRKALEIFQRLSLHIKTITENLKMDKIVFYSEAIDLMDKWPNATYLKALQQGEDLGERMKNAFEAGFETGYSSICIIGTDCYELTSEVILRAFEALKSSDAVIGPAKDGGYYLLGTNKPQPELFQNKEWSTETVFKETIRDFESLQLTYAQLQTLNDVDTEDDLPPELKD
ncbi:MAG TPA: TIGR04282 family arsenosugar biosynthesis glycosyltransferase [Chryseosolibacter sp.]|nr:TIGR04282 family arsenosugar biosynthesis glycosyltransferase [Chryseosolibacter sp.]